MNGWNGKLQLSISTINLKKFKKKLKGLKNTKSKKSVK